MNMAPERGYDTAKAMLKQQFGEDYLVSAAYMKKVLGCPMIKYENITALQEYALFLRGCCNAMADLQYMQELDMPTNMRTVILKLPFKFREKWRTTACDIMERQKRRARFNDVVTFIEYQVKVISDPIFGSIQNLETKPTGKPKDIYKFKPQSQSKPKFKGDSFATNVIHVDKPIVGKTKSTNDEHSSSQSKSNLSSCLFCSQGHSLEQCTGFGKKKHREKVSFIKEKAVCFGCLLVGHRSKDCKRRLTCKVCNQKHPSVLHIFSKELKVDKAVSTNDEQNAEPSINNVLVSAQTCGHTGAGSNNDILPILPVQVKSAVGNKVIQTYAFLDTGSTSTFCSENLMRKLHLNGRKTKISLLTMSPKTTVSSYVVNNLEISSLNGKVFYGLPEVYTQKQMPVSPANIVEQKDLTKWPYLDGIYIPHIQAEVELLIGTNASKLLEPWQVVNSQGDGPYAVRTLLGWVVNGSLGSSQNEQHTARVNRVSVETLELLLEKQYQHDFSEKLSDDKEEMSQQDKRFMEIMEKSVSFKSGHYSLKLPFKEKDLAMPNNLNVAKQRLLGTKRKLERNMKFQQEYTDFMNDMMSQGYAEKVPEHQLDRDDGKVWYIPHHGVYHPRKGKLRVVFDCGAEYSGASLNSQLLQGPNLTNSLIGVLLRFRQEPIAFMTDIKAMFYQVTVAEEDRDFLRFLWWPDGDVTQDVAVFRMTVHLFGAVSSPSCACFALRRTAEDNQHCFSEEVSDTVYKNFYMDDCLKSVPTEQAAIQMIKDLTALCHKGGFHLTQWMSNSREVLLSITEQDRSKNLHELNLDRDQLPVERALGLQWCVQTDTFNFKTVCKEKTPTRRGILSVVSSVYDPLGYLAPLTLPVKLILQELCRTNHNWDDEIPKVLEQRWTKWITDLDQLNTFKVDRCLKPSNFGELASAQLHHFSDASGSGYGSVTYLRLQNCNNDVHVSFLLGKSRVAPLKSVTIPRLELTAAVLAVHIDKMLRKQLQLQLENSCFWTDSTSVLKYIKNENKRFRTFVANRISAIREASDVTQWKYIHTSQNPADVASRGLTVQQLVTSKEWLNGPEFLKEPVSTWSKDNIDLNVVDNDPELKKELSANAVTIEVIENATPIG
nr:uncharacterized protein LOC129443292 [Misgurnus anguillicaudatus]